MQTLMARAICINWISTLGSQFYEYVKRTPIRKKRTLFFARVRVFPPSNKERGQHKPVRLGLPNFFWPDKIHRKCPLCTHTTKSPTAFIQNNVGFLKRGSFDYKPVLQQSYTVKNTREFIKLFVVSTIY